MRASHSQIQCYKSCRRLWYLKYIEGMQSTTKVEALERGTTYHDGVDALNKGEDFQIENPKYMAMVKAYEKYIMPNFKVVRSEEWFEYRIPKETHTLVGRIDGMTEDGVLVEHKTVSSPIDEQYMYQLNFDEQVLTYMMAHNVTQMWYTVCQTPTIRQKKSETDGEFFQRCLEWYGTDTKTKIDCVFIERTQEQIDKHRIEMAQIMDEMEYCKLFYRNTGYCNKWGRFCEYSTVCLDYSPDKEYIGFERSKK